MYVIMKDEGKNLISHASLWFSIYHAFLAQSLHLI